MDLKHSLTLAACLCASSLLAQTDDGATHVFRGNIKTVQLYAKGSQITPPVITLNAGDRLDLAFDDLDGDTKTYSYIYELRNEDWSPSGLNAMEYTKGFAGIQIDQYRPSALAITRYTHYHATLPDPNYMPTKGGNYLLKVFVSGDQDNPVFQVRMLVLNNSMSVGGLEVQPPFTDEVHTTHQKVQFTVSTGAHQLNSPTQEVKVVIVQNWRWETAKYDIHPSFVRQGYLEYNPEADAVFPGTREWRWLDIRSFRFQSDRIAKLDEGTTRINVVVRPDQSRAGFPYVVYQDQNGSYNIITTDGVNPTYQGDYGHIYFTYVPPDGQPYDGKDLYLFGALTNYEFNDSTRMTWDPAHNVYHCAQYLKQGYYDYIYVLRSPDGTVDSTPTEGNFFETENNYLVLVYYRPLGGRWDELVGVGRVNSLAQNNAERAR
jgi:hypothetical protein